METVLRALGIMADTKSQMNGKGAIVKMLQRRLGVEKSNTASVGDSMGDVGMFGESACAVLFNPWDDRRDLSLTT